MKEYSKEIRKHLCILRELIKNCFIGYLEYRASLVMEIVSEVAYMFLKIVYIVVIYNTNVPINGGSPEYILVLGGSYMILTGIFVGFFMMNIFTIPNHIKKGTLDIYITKPVSLQFIISFRRFQFGAAIPNIIGGIITMLIGLRALDYHINIVNLIGFIILMINSNVIAYSLFFSLEMLSFWMIKTNSFNDVLEKLWDNNNMPMSIYGRIIQRICIFFIPMFVISNFPVMVLLEQLSWPYIVWSFVCAVLFFTLARVFWKKAIKNYCSASS